MLSSVSSRGWRGPGEARGGKGGFLVPAGLASPGFCCVGLRPRTFRGGHCPGGSPAGRATGQSPVYGCPASSRGEAAGSPGVGSTRALAHLPSASWWEVPRVPTAPEPQPHSTTPAWFPAVSVATPTGSFQGHLCLLATPQQRWTGSDLSILRTLPAIQRLQSVSPVGSESWPLGECPISVWSFLACCPSAPECSLGYSFTSFKLIPCKASTILYNKSSCSDNPVYLFPDQTLTNIAEVLVSHRSMANFIFL